MHANLRQILTQLPSVCTEVLSISKIFERDCFFETPNTPNALPRQGIRLDIERDCLVTRTIDHNHLALSKGTITE